MANAATYAKMHRKYLETAYPAVYRELKATGALTAHVARAGERAMQMYEAMERQMKAQINARNLDHLQKVKEYEQIPHVVEEIVLSEAVHSL